MIGFLRRMFRVVPQSVAQITQQFHSMVTELTEYQAAMAQRSEDLGEEIERLSNEMGAAQVEEHLASKVRMKILDILH